MPCRAAPVMPFCCAKASSEAMTSSPPSRTSRNWRCRAGSNALLFMRANCASFALHDVEKKERRRPRRLAREPLALGGKDAAALAARAREGIEVRLLLDYSGSSRMESRLVALLQDAGCELHRFHPLRLSNIGIMNNRTHRKIAVIDGRIGFIGGHGIAEQWTGNA